LDWTDVFGAATIYVILSVLACAAAIRITSRQIRGLGRQTVLVAVWFAPLMLLLGERSMWGVVAASALAASATRLLYRGNDAGDSVDGWIRPDVIRYPDRPPLISQLVPSLAASVALQGGVVAGITAHPRAAAALIGAGAAVLTWSSTKRRVWAPRRAGGGSVRIVMMTVMAIILTAAGLMRYLDLSGPGAEMTADSRAKRGIVGRMLELFLPGRKPAATFNGSERASRESLESARSLLNMLLAGKDPARAANTSAASAAQKQTGDFVGTGGLYDGVILWPEIQERTTLIPPLPVLARGLGAARRSMVIPFYGAYWLFKPPFRKPPANSHIARGDPAKLAFRSTDRVPLRMQAKQDLGTLFEVSCCSRIELVLRNADRFPGTVTVELILANSQIRGPSMSLGEATVTSTPRWGPGPEPPPVNEVVSFPIPSDAPLRQFDQLTIVFHLSPPRSDRSAKIAIERFVLTPKSL
jgi:hypothetical protein